MPFVKLIAFLHGLGMMPQTWQDQVTSLPSNRFKAVAPWLKGLRPGRQDGFTVNDACDDIFSLLNPHGVDTITLVGSDLGATIALACATRAPEAVSDLVIAASSFSFNAIALRAQRAVLRVTPESRFRGAGLNKALMLTILDELAALDLTSQLGSITARTLIMAGGADKASMALGEALASAIPGARLEVVPGAEAAVHLSAPDAFNRSLWDFVDGMPDLGDFPELDGFPEP